MYCSMYFLCSGLSSKTPPVSARSYAGEDQTALTFVLHTIKYGAGAKEGLPSSLAIKIHAEGEPQREASAGILLYEVYFYTQLLDSVPVKTPRPLAIWTDGSDGTDASAPAMRYFALMMEDMSIENDVFDSTCLNPDRTMTVDQIRATNKQQLAIHDRFWNSPLIDVYPMTNPGKGILDNFRSGLPALEGQWKTMKEQAALKAKKHNADLWGPGLAGWPESWNEFIPFLDDFCKLETAERFLANLEVAWKDRPCTLLHGDVNTGNLWQRKDGSSGDELVFGDWQLIMKSPIAWDFVTIFLCTKGVDTVALLKEYYAELLNVRPEVAETYPYETLLNDVAVSMTLFWIVAIPILAGVASADLPEDKEAFTWKSYIGPFLASQTMQVIDQYDSVPQSVQRRPRGHLQVKGAG